MEDKLPSGADKPDDKPFPIGDGTPEPKPTPEPKKDPLPPDAPTPGTEDQPPEPKIELKTDDDEDQLPVSLDDFNAALSGVDPKPKEKEVTPSEKEGQKEGQEKRDDGVLKQGRDYSDIDEAHVPLFKNMSNEAFAFAKDIYLEKKQFDQRVKERDEEVAKLKEGKVPDSYYEHPEAFQLTEEFKQGANAYQAANLILQHWKQQLINLRKGDAVVDLSIDDKGQFVLGEPKEPTAEDEVTITGYLQHAQSQTRQIQNDIAQLQNSHASNYKKAIASVEDAKKHYFKPYMDEKHPMQKVIKEVKDKLPPTFKNNPLADLFAMSFAANYEMSTRIKQFIADSKKQKAVADDKKLAGPNAGDIGAEGGTNNSDVDSTVKFADFGKRMDS